MSRYSAEGNSLLYYVPSIANKAAPTVAELNAGTNLTAFVPPDGWNPTTTQNNVDIASLADTFDVMVIGTEGGPITVTFQRDNSADTAWNLFTRGLAGFFAFREGISKDTVWTAAQAVQVYPIQAHHPIANQTARNAARTFNVTVAVTSEPNRKAVVAA
jgi:hypothetical protein